MNSELVNVVNAIVSEVRKAALVRDIDPIIRRCERCQTAYGADFTNMWNDAMQLLAADVRFNLQSTCEEAKDLENRWMALRAEVLKRLDDASPGADFSREAAMMLEFIEHHGAIRVELLMYSISLYMLMHELENDATDAVINRQITERLWSLGVIAARKHSFLNAPLRRSEKPRH